jgi:4-methylaminobutanoate oxidase (formaldehyde-forming)
MRRHIDAEPLAHAFVTDVTSGFAQINIQGPRSRELMQSITTHDLSNEAFPFRSAHEIDIGYARALCVRITYLGELGYELYIPTEQATHVYDRLVEAGKHVGLRHAGLKALASLRMEKGYRDYGHDIDNTDSVLEAGLGFAVDMKKPGGFLGRDAVEQKGCRPAHASHRADPGEGSRAHALPRGDRAPKRQGVGYIRAASYGFTVGGAVGLAMIEAGEPVEREVLRRRKVGSRDRRQALPSHRLDEAALRPYERKSEVLGFVDARR